MISEDFLIVFPIGTVSVIWVSRNNSQKWAIFVGMKDMQNTLGDDEGVVRGTFFERKQQKQDP